MTADEMLRDPARVRRAIEQASDRMLDDIVKCIVYDAEHVPGGQLQRMLRAHFCNVVWREARARGVTTGGSGNGHGSSEPGLLR